MRKYLTIAFLLIIPLLLDAQPNNDEDLKKKGSYIRFEPAEVDLGKIPMNSVTDETGNVDIVIHNDGAKPLIIQQVTACCGTTVKEWPKQPILPGHSGTVKVYFRVESRPQRISRTVTVTSNAVNGNSQKVAILGEVIVPPAKNEIQL
jgi:hypothetical protein